MGAWLSPLIPPPSGTSVKSLQEPGPVLGYLTLVLQGTIVEGYNLDDMPLGSPEKLSSVGVTWPAPVHGNKETVHHQDLLPVQVDYTQKDVIIFANCCKFLE
ncbi:hypothetical protein K439DRAFT_1610692 [Ramaria rubella]|nr:hypothetical protein K439DRAFT_1610692 [Ramaria rubella]